MRSSITSQRARRNMNFGVLPRLTCLRWLVGREPLRAHHWQYSCIVTPAQWQCPRRCVAACIRGTLVRRSQATCPMQSPVAPSAGGLVRHTIRTALKEVFRADLVSDDALHANRRQADCRSQSIGRSNLTSSSESKLQRLR